MTLDDLRGMAGYAYVATPYAKYKFGTDVAFMEAERHTEHLAFAYRIPAFSPIVHGHRLSRHRRLEPCDHDLWMRLNQPLMEGAEAMILVKLSGWDESRGVAEEAAYFQSAGKPIVEMEALP